MINKGRMPSIAPASAKFGDPVRILYMVLLRFMGYCRYLLDLPKAELNAFQPSSPRSLRVFGR